MCHRADRDVKFFECYWKPKCWDETCRFIRTACSVVVLHTPGNLQDAPEPTRRRSDEPTGPPHAHSERQSRSARRSVALSEGRCLRKTSRRYAMIGFTHPVELCRRAPRLRPVLTFVVTATLDLPARRRCADLGSLPQAGGSAFAPSVGRTATYIPELRVCAASLY